MYIWQTQKKAGTRKRETKTDGTNIKQIANIRHVSICTINVNRLTII